MRAPDVVCRHCRLSDEVVRCGKNKGVQSYLCRRCTHKFTLSSELPGYRTRRAIIDRSLQLYDVGDSYREILSVLAEEFDVHPSGSTLHDWIHASRATPKGSKKEQSEKSWERRPYRHVLNALAAIGVYYYKVIPHIDDDWPKTQGDEEVMESLVDKGAGVINKWRTRDPVLYANAVLGRQAVSCPEEITDAITDESLENTWEIIWDYYDRVRAKNEH